MTAGQASPQVPAPARLPGLSSPGISAAEFERVRAVLYDASGIKLPDGKQELIKARLWKRMRGLGVASFDAYMDLVEADRSDAELLEMIDLLTTNKTHFFREDAHFDFVVENLFRPWAQAGGRRLRIWSAGCSSGEEPYTLSIVLQETTAAAASNDARILATDISPTVLQMAQRAQYDASQLTDAPEAIKRKWFKSTGDADRYEVSSDARRLVTFRHLNLMHEWPMKGPFDTIWCRNVMIYFDQKTRNRLINRFAGLLRPGGYFFCGHAESATGASESLKFIKAGVYEKLR